MSNLLVHVIVYKSQSWDVVEGFTIDEADLNCSDLPFTDGETDKIAGVKRYTSPKSWCQAKALNTPIITSKGGTGILIFNIDPPPKTIASLGSDQMDHDIPLLHWKSGKLQGAAGMELASSKNEWNAGITDPRTIKLPAEKQGL